MKSQASKDVESKIGMQIDDLLFSSKHHGIMSPTHDSVQFTPGEELCLQLINMYLGLEAYKKHEDNRNMHTAREELIKLQLSPRSLVENIAILLDEVLETKESQDRNRTRNASVTDAEAQLRVSNLDDPYEINITKGSVDKADLYLENKYNELK